MSTVPLRYCTMRDGKKCNLGVWLCNQRKMKSLSKLSPERVALFTPLVDNEQFTWTPSSRSSHSEDTWIEMFQLLVCYCTDKLRQTGHTVTSIPESLVVQEMRLGRWLHTQNKLRRKSQLRYDRLLRFHELIDNGIYNWPTPKTKKF